VRPEALVRDASLTWTRPHHGTFTASSRNSFVSVRLSGRGQPGWHQSHNLLAHVYRSTRSTVTSDMSERYYMSSSSDPRNRKGPSPNDRCVISDEKSFSRRHTYKNFVDNCARSVRKRNDPACACHSYPNGDLLRRPGVSLAFAGFVDASPTLPSGGPGTPRQSESHRSDGGNTCVTHTLSSGRSALRTLRSSLGPDTFLTKFIDRRHPRRRGIEGLTASRARSGRDLIRIIHVKLAHFIKSYPQFAAGSTSCLFGRQRDVPADRSYRTSSRQPYR